MFMDTGEFNIKPAGSGSDSMSIIRAILKTQQEDLRDIKKSVDRLILLEERNLNHQKYIDDLRKEVEKIHIEIGHWRMFRVIGAWVLGGGGIITAIVSVYIMKALNT
jgi:hypothetical protein